MHFWQIVLLAMVQGLTEFLPVSSSGHLVIVAAMFSRGQTAALDMADLNVVLHAGTLLSILLFYGQQVIRLFEDQRRLLGLIAVALTPSLIVGALMHLWFRGVWSDPLLAGSLLIATGGVLLIAKRWSHGIGSHDQMTHWQALLIGATQAVAILPGISRSGATIAVGMRLGLSPRAAATFSFLLAIPTIAVAAAVECVELSQATARTTSLAMLVIGASTALAVGYFSLRWLHQLLERGRFHLFAFWCIPVGVAAIVWQTIQS